MSRAVVNLLLDAVLLVATLALVCTSCLLHLVFPHATRASGWVLWGLDYDDWAQVQFSLLGVLVLGILVHLMLHWTWVCGIISARLLRRLGKPDDGVQTLYGVTTLLAVIVLTSGLLLAAHLSIHPPRP